MSAVTREQLEGAIRRAGYDLVADFNAEQASGLTDAVMALLAGAEPKVLAEGEVDHYISSTTYEADDALVAIRVGSAARDMAAGTRVVIVEAAD